ncbi:MAG: tetratricopeptide repeat protein [Syntrophaceae bacterium]
MPQEKGINITKSTNVLIILLLVVATLLVFWQVQGYEFVNFDDPQYVTNNIHVRQGMTWDNLRYAFTEDASGYWHPLTWLSLMADRQLFLNNAGGYHWTSLLIHILNTIILFFVFQSITRAPWKSGFVAALFAVHPLHVEAVAWIAARKDVLSGFFWMLSLWAYVFYVKKPSLYRYILILLAFALGMMAKPTVVTIPFVLLLLDYWPLKSNVHKEKMTKDKFSGRVPDGKGGSQASWLFLILEKIPLVILAVILSLNSLFLPGKAAGPLVSLQDLPLLDRLQHASVSYITYLIKTFYPINLVVFYPRISHLLALKAILAVCLITIISLFVFFTRKKYPYLIVGWLWYLGSLLPVIGLIHAWGHEIADRYTYLPLIGIFIMMSWGIRELVSLLPKRQTFISFFIGLYLVLLMVLSWHQVSFWQNSDTLWKHTLEITNGNFLFHYNLGSDLAKKGDMDGAIREYKSAITYSQENAVIHKDLAITFNASVHNNLAIALMSKGDHNNALKEFMTVIHLKPDHAGAYNNIAMLLYAQGNISGAIPYFREAIGLQPSFANAHFYLAMALKKQGRTDEAEVHFKKASQINPIYRKNNTEIK